MAPDQGFGIPGWFIALFVLVVVIGVVTTVWRISVARRIAREAGLDPNTATAVTMLSRDGMDAAYLASALRSRPPEQQPPAMPPSRTAEQRLGELRTLLDRGLITQDEYESRRAEILRSI